MGRSIHTRLEIRIIYDGPSQEVHDNVHCNVINFCHFGLERNESRWDKLGGGGAEVVAVTADGPTVTLNTQSITGTPFF